MTDNVTSIRPPAELESEPANTSDVDLILGAVHLACEAMASEAMSVGASTIAMDVWFQLRIVDELLERLRAKIEGGNAKAKLTLI